MIQILILILYGLAGVTGLGFVAAVMVWAFDGTVNIGAAGLLALLTLVWMIFSVVLQHRYAGQSGKTSAIASGEKAKHGVGDMYAMIDRLVQELTLDEREYLQQRLGETMQDDDGELVTTLESLLAERDEQRMGH